MTSASASPAPHPVHGPGKMGHHLVGIGHLGQVFAFGTRLLARTSLRRSPFGPVGRRFGQTFG